MLKEIAYSTGCLIMLSVGCLTPSPAAAEGPDEGLVVIVNKANPVNEIKKADLERIFKLQKQFWGGGERIVLFMREAGSPERQSALKLIYNMTEGQVGLFMLRKLYSGESSAVPKDMRSSSDMKQVVASTPNAIGYLSKSAVDESVKIVKIDGAEVLK